jgi:UDP-glucose 4-epimerase
MRAVVTGAAGFIGSNLVDRLLDDGHHVVGIDNYCTGSATNLERALSFNLHNKQRRFTLLKADILAPELVDIVAGAAPHVIFHLAAQVDTGTAIADPQLDARSNVLGTINLCEASRQAGVRRIVYAASGASRYGALSCRVDETDQVDPLSPNAVAKLAGEMYLRAYAEMYGLAPICLALANVYGPRQNTHGIAGRVVQLSTAMITGNPYVVYRDNTAAHDYVYVEDVVDAFMKAGSAPISTTGTYNIGTGQQITLADVYGTITAVLDGTSSFVCADGADLQTLALDCAKAAQGLEWKPTVDLAEGIRRTLCWLSATLEPESPALASA